MTTRLQHPLLLFGFIPPLFITALVLRYSVNVPVDDEWSWVPLIARLHSGAVAFSDLWQQHNEHRMLFPALITLALAQVGGWNVARECVISIALALGTLALLFRLQQLTLPGSAVPAMFVLTSAVLFSTAQAQNWLWGYQLAWFLVNLSTVGALFILTTKGLSGEWVAAAVALAVIASYSVAAGLNVWVIGLVVIAIRTGIFSAFTLGWAAAAVATAALYVHGYQHPPYHADPLSSVSHPRALAVYIAAYFGSAFGRSGGIVFSSLLGSIGIGAFVFLSLRLWRDRTRMTAALPWLSIGAFSALTAVMTAVGRLPLGVEQSLSGRYVTFSSLFWIALMALFAQYASSHAGEVRMPAVRVGLAVLALVFVTGFVASSSSAMSEFKSTFKKDEKGRQAVLNYSRSSEYSLEKILPLPDVARKYSGILDQDSDGPFYP